MTTMKVIWQKEALCQCLENLLKWIQEKGNYKQIGTLHYIFDA
jgi:hypothetical protein